MGLLSKIFGFKRSDSSADTKVLANYPDEYKQILKFRDSLNSILGKDRFIARSDYDGLVKEHSSLCFFIKSGTLVTSASFLYVSENRSITFRSRLLDST